MYKYIVFYLLFLFFIFIRKSSGETDFTDFSRFSKDYTPQRVMEIYIDLTSSNKVSVLIILEDKENCEFAFMEHGNENEFKYENIKFSKGLLNILLRNANGNGSDGLANYGSLLNLFF